MNDYRKGALGAATVIFAAALLFVAYQTWARVNVMWGFLAPIMAQAQAQQSRQAAPVPAPAPSPSPSPVEKVK